jgi:hypothetical protein
MGRPRKRARNEDQVLESNGESTTTAHSSAPGLTTPNSLDLEQSFHIDTTGLDDTNFNFPQHHDSFLDQDLLPYDPALLITTPPAEPVYQPTDDIVPNSPCGCLSNMFLTLSNLQAQPAFDFPICLPTLRLAITTTKDVLNCEECPKQISSGTQNIMLLTTLLTSITDCYRKLLISIDADAELATSTGAKKSFRMGDNSPQNAHLHTGTPDCPMGFEVDLDGDEWRVLARKVVKADVEGRGVAGGGGVLGLADLLEARQIKWHSDPATVEMRKHYTKGGDEECATREGSFSCFRLIQMVRQHVELLRL